MGINMTVATVVTSTMPNVPVLSGTEGSLVALIRYIAPILGWEIMFDNGPVIVIRPQSYKGGQALLYRFDDRAERGGAAPRVAGVSAYESMSDINTGAGLVGPGYVSKSSSANTTARPWLVVGDQYGFYLFTDTAFFSNSSPMNTQYFGFLNGLFSTDIPICALMGGADSASDNTYSYIGLDYFKASENVSDIYCYIHRNIDGVLNTKVTCRSASYLSGLSESGSYYAMSAEFAYDGNATQRYMLPYPYKGNLVYFDYLIFSKQGSLGFAPEAIMPGFYAHAHRSSNLPVYPSTLTADNKTFMVKAIITVGQYYCKTGSALIEISGGFRQ